MALEAVAGTESRKHEALRRLERFVVGGSAGAATGGVGALVLSIIGLAGVAPLDLSAIAAIALGAGVLIESLFIGAEYSKLRGYVPDNRRVNSTMLAGTLGVEGLAGVVAAILGVLALVGLSAQTLVSIAALVLGGGLLLGAGMLPSLNALKIESHKERDAVRVARRATNVALGAEMLAGAGAIVLCILALTGIAPQVLNLVALLALGVSAMLSGSAIAARMLTTFGWA